MSFYKELEDVKSSMRRRNIGANENKDAYSKTTGRAGDVLLFGPYKIRQDEWGWLSAQAGIPGAKWFDAHAQNAVVDHQLTQMFNQFGGRWDVTLAGWEAGTEVASRLYAGETIKEVVKGDGAEQLQVYVNEVVSGSQAPVESTVAGNVDLAAGAPFTNASLVDQRPAAVRKTRTPESVVKGAMTSMRNAQLKNTMEPKTEEVSDDGLEVDQRSGADA